MPRIRQARPDAHLVVTGPRSHDPRLEPYSQQGLRLTGYVEDVRPEVSRSAACVVPARLGSGTKTKVLEAMALGTPVVATSKGIEGLAIEPGAQALVADDPAELAELVVRLLGDRALGDRLAAAGRSLVEIRYDYAAIFREFSRVCEEVVAAGRRPA
jgi:glycosyltransferase involved in cell wall biosynthesis